MSKGCAWRNAPLFVFMLLYLLGNGYVRANRSVPSLHFISDGNFLVSIASSMKAMMNTVDMRLLRLHCAVVPMIVALLHLI